MKQLNQPYKFLDIWVGRAIADDGYIKVNVLVEIYGPLDCFDNPIDVVAECPTAKKRQK